MEISGTGLRDSINGERAVLPAPRRLRPIRDPDDLSPRRRLPVGIGAAGLAAVTGMAAALWLSFGSGDGEEAAAPEATPIVGRVTVITTLEAEALMPDSGISRAPAPVGLNGRDTRTEADPVRRSADAPAGPVARLAHAGDGAALPTGPGATAAGGAEQAPAAALVLARANLDWARIFSAEGMAYQPLAHAPRASWAQGACAGRSQPEGPAYCALDGTVYLDGTEPAGPLAILDIAHEVGRHVQDMMGVRLRPLAGEDRDLQADCFAGMWAAGSSDLAALAPGALRQEMGGGYPLGPWQRARLDAYVTGYAASGFDACAAIGEPQARTAEAAPDSALPPPPPRPGTAQAAD